MNIDDITELEEYIDNHERLYHEISNAKNKSIDNIKMTEFKQNYDLLHAEARVKKVSDEIYAKQFREVYKQLDSNP